jgi:HPt (histidine-containing phosphotransfer) domain-containing protein
MLAAVDHDLELLRELVEIFLAESPGLLAQICTGVKEHRAEPVERNAHSLKGALASFGARRACAVAQQVETRAREARLDDAARLLSALESELVLACQALSDYLREAHLERAPR